MAVQKVLVINACGTVEGDMAMMLLGLSHLDEEQFEVFVVSIPRGAVYERLQGMRCIKKIIPMELGGIELPPTTRNGKLSKLAEVSGAIQRLTRLVWRERIDVIYTIDRTVAASLAQIVSRITGRPFVLSAHYPDYPAISRRNRAVVRQASLIHGPSEYLLQSYRPYVTHPERLVKTANGLEISHYDPSLSGEKIRQELGIAAEAPLILLAGRLSPFKGQDDLIEAARYILNVQPVAQFVLAGHDSHEGIFTHGPQATSFKLVLEELIARYDLERCVHLVGHYSNAVDRSPNLQTLFAAATVCTMPSWAEPFGLVALEAMAMGKPVVATNAGGVPEFMIDGETGLLVPPRDPRRLADAVLELLQYPERARSMGMQGRQRVETLFTADLYGERVTRVLRAARSKRALKATDQLSFVAVK